MNFKLTIQPGTQRVFVCIPVDEQSQQHINELIKPIRNTTQDVRWEPERNRHLTLAFLGIMPSSEVENLIRLFDETYQQEKRFQYKLSTLTRFPKPTGRIIALVENPVTQLSRLFQITQNLLQQNNINTDLKSFRPHITLGKMRKAKQVKRKFHQPTNINLKINKIALYQSILTESGSIYSSLKETGLN